MCHCVMLLSSLWWRWSVMVWILDWTPALSFQQSSTSRCCPHAGCWTGLLGWSQPLAPSFLLLFLVVCFYFPQCFPLASLRWFPAPCVEYLVLFRCPSVTFVGSLLAWCRCWGCFNLSPSRRLQAMNSQTSFPKLLLLYYFLLEMAERLEIPGKWWLHPWRAALHLCSQRNIPEHVVFAVCYEYICVLR